VPGSVICDAHVALQEPFGSRWLSPIRTVVIADKALLVIAELAVLGTESLPNIVSIVS
jgi:hypothetical protein